ncbi:chaperone protein dnaJ 20, chloroplastic-like [Gastrolobium bilobum]|uniref:chaperone protein dnaJ 20, chloroplastic-like n=1 Tax=Gastrolobium bilobum TaxID=150636 RepID=UPI002AB2F01E|nr:chaperone protein dnaJ 20, chloroplastic-like [Gastrolobium bilobum]
MAVLSLSSSLSISKPFQCVPLSTKQQRTSHMQFSVSCRATKTTHGNFYKMLSLSPGSATMDEIKRAYRSMALQYHPDVCHDPSMKEESTRMFVQLNAAYKTLTNPMLRAKYDSELGLRNKMCVSEEIWRNRWQEQVVELKKRSCRRMGQKGGSWGTRMRTQSMKHRN